MSALEMRGSLRSAALIAAREFRTYVATGSFWLAMLVGPLTLGAGLLLSQLGQERGPAPATVSVVRTASGATVEFSKDFPLSPAGRTAVLDAIERDGRVPGQVREATPPPATERDAGGIARFTLVAMLWMVLTGSLGMLLQAVVRERANRALESLLAAATPLEIVTGKLVGVGAVSCLVIGTWLAGTVAFALMTPASGAFAGLLVEVARPALLAKATLAYILAFAAYGFAAVAAGASARDNADAQNLARPMFIVLLVVFFTAMAAAGEGGAGLSWLAYVPPFAPFMLLMIEQSWVETAAALSLLVGFTLAMGAFAARALRLDPLQLSIRGSRLTRP